MLFRAGRAIRALLKSEYGDPGDQRNVAGKRERLTAPPEEGGTQGAEGVKR